MGDRAPIFSSAPCIPELRLASERCGRNTRHSRRLAFISSKLQLFGWRYFRLALRGGLLSAAPIFGPWAKRIVVFDALDLDPLVAGQIELVWNNLSTCHRSKGSIARSSLASLWPMVKHQGV
jgi:hypothetical protein